MKPLREPTVDAALAREHGLSDEEWQRILQILGRTPTFPELGIFSVMWSEHCSYKSSKRWLRGLPTEGEQVLEMSAGDAASRGLTDGQAVRVFNDRGSYVCRLDVSGRAREGVVHGLGIWWRKLGADGRNVNEVTHQRLTDMGRAPCFYDCLVEVAAA